MLLINIKKRKIDDVNYDNSFYSLLTILLKNYWKKSKLVDSNTIS